MGHRSILGYLIYGFEFAQANTVEDYRMQDRNSRIIAMHVEKGFIKRAMQPFPTSIICCPGVTINPFLQSTNLGLRLQVKRCNCSSKRQHLAETGAHMDPQRPCAHNGEPPKSLLIATRRGDPHLPATRRNINVIDMPMVGQPDCMGPGNRHSAAR
jgi:hypothetical protein